MRNGPKFLNENSMPISKSTDILKKHVEKCDSKLDALQAKFRAHSSQSEKERIAREINKLCQYVIGLTDAVELLGITIE